MATVKLIFSEERSQVRRINVEVEIDGDDLDSPHMLQAAEAAIKAYEEGKYDIALEEAESDTTECRNEVAYYNEAGEYVVVLPWD